MMATFRARVADAAGKRFVVVRTGPQKDTVLRDLHQEGLFVLDLEEATGEVVEGPRVSRRTLLEFTQSLSSWLNNGLNLGQALQLGTTVMLRDPVKDLVKLLANEVQKGRMLYEALAGIKGIDPLYLGLVRIGESTGNLPPVFARLVDYLLARKQIREKTSNALVYPALVLSVAAVGVVLMITLVFPSLTEILSSVSPTAVARYKEGLQSVAIVGWILGLLCLLLGISIPIWLRTGGNTSHHRLLWDGFWLRVPVIGPFLSAGFVWNFSFAMETLLASGYSVDAGLTEAQSVVSNVYLRHRLGLVKERVVKGEALSHALVAEKDFPSTMVAWVSVGESVNDLGKSFSQMKLHFQEQWERSIARWMALVEPGLILVVGMVLVGLILSFVTPLFSLLGNIL